MRMITKEEECWGKCSDKRYAMRQAEIETDVTGKAHTHFLSHYYCPYDHIEKMYWGVLVRPPGIDPVTFQPIEPIISTNKAEVKYHEIDD